MCNIGIYFLSEVMEIFVQKQMTAKIANRGTSPPPVPSEAVGGADFIWPMTTVASRSKTLQDKTKLFLVMQAGSLQDSRPIRH